MFCSVDVCSWDEACMLCSSGGVHVCFVLLISVAGTRCVLCSSDGLHICFVLLMSVAGTRRVCCVQVVVYMYALSC